MEQTAGDPARDPHRQPTVFLSAVTSELGAARDILASVFEKHGADAIVQRDYPSGLSDGYAIARTIESADLVVCLIGYAYGAELPKGNRPPEATPGCSWTQWEYLYARARAKEVRLFVFDGQPGTGTQAERFAQRQIAFRKRVEKVAMTTFGGAFFRRFDGPEKLLQDVTNYLEHVDGALATFRDATWARIKSAYRSGRIDAWGASFPRTYRGPERTSDQERTDLMCAEHPPFIASQGFCVLVPGSNGAQAQYLKPAAFLPGRDSEAEAIARAESEWRRAERDEVAEVLRRPHDAGLQIAGVAVPNPRRLFLISGGGVGKSTNMRWFEATVNSTGDVFAVLVLADKLIGQDDDSVLSALTEKVAHDSGEAGNAWSEHTIATGLLQEAAAGRLIILIDGLDHVEAEKIGLLLSIQSNLPVRYWSKCGVLVAGRPQAIQGWEDAPAHRERTVAVGMWRFLEPAEFQPHEAEIFLGTSDGESRFRLVDDKLAKLIQVPRVLEYVRTLPKSQLIGVRSSADVYEKATRELIKRTLKEGGAPARKIGPNWVQDVERQIAHSEQIDYVMKLLSAIAFVALCQTTDPAFRVARKSVLLVLDRHVKDDLWRRIAPQDQIPGSESEDFTRDLRALGKFANILGNSLLDATDTDTDTLRTVVWSNRTVHQFLAAYWLANHARGFESLAARLAGKDVEYEVEDPNRDTDRFRNYVFCPEADYLDSRYEKTDITYEFNQFLAEMPATALSAESWVAAASAWYDPEPFAELGPGAFPRAWPAEMLYRSWSTMVDIASWPFDDWWDLPYEQLIRHSSRRDRARVSLHAERQPPQNNPRAARVAQAVLKRFFGDYEAILRGERGAQQQAFAKEMVADENWIVVQGGSFAMGAPLEKQGFPSKVKAYWIKELDDIQTGKVTAEKAAEQNTREEWTTGAQGKRLRDRDIQWLTEVYRPLEPAPSSAALAIPNRDVPAYRDALTALENNWSRRDETPLEAQQHVATFTMHRYTILQRWFWLFSPGHRDVVQRYLTETELPGDDHPATYISWYDAWAFCQWATWSATDAPGSARQYGLRLPHEPEWEYAAAWATDDTGSPKLIPYGQRYWWGDSFYQDEHSPNEESLSTDVAHAIGNPGRTRSPLNVTPNGLGFHDILGNVWEWTANLYDTRKEEDTKGLEILHYSRLYPEGRPPVNCARTMRGGLWYILDLLAHRTARFRLYCDDRDYKMGFRVVREERT